MLNREDFKIGIYPLAVMVYTTIFLSLVLLPKVKYSIPYIWNAGFCLLPVLIYVLKDKVNLYKIIVMVAVGILSGTLMWVQGNTVISDIINEPIRAVRYFVPCILLILINEAGRKQQIYVWCVASIILIYIGGLTLRELALNPMIARILANGSSDAELNQYRMMNIGGFGVSYGIGLTFPLWVSLFFEVKRVSIKIPALCAMFFTLYFVISAQYMTLLLLCLLSFLIAYIMKMRTALSRIAGCMIVALIVFQAGAILRWIAALGVVEAQIYSRLINVAGVFEGTGRLGDTTSRIELYLDAFREFLHNPIMGTLHSAAAPVSHSTFLGIAASGGIIGVGCYSIGIAFCYKTCMNVLRKENLDIRPFVTDFCIFVILAFLNPVNYAYEISVVLFLYVPLTLQVFNITSQEKEGLYGEAVMED